MVPDVSVVIPCYNSGEFLPDALQSIEEYNGSHTYEVVIVDDGSTDEVTKKYLAGIIKPNYLVVYQENQGPAAARNTGVKNAKSDIVLFLDSDNKIRSRVFIDEGLAIMNKIADVGVVYGNAAFFGETGEERFSSAPFDLKKLLDGNYIDMCSMIRKKVWQQVDGLDENRMIIGHEDWDFWLRIARTNWKFYYCNLLLFDYRARANSLITQSVDPASFSKMWNYVLGKQVDALSLSYRELYYKYEALVNLYENDRKSPLRTFIKNIVHVFRKAG